MLEPTNYETDYRTEAVLFGWLKLEVYVSTSHMVGW